MKYDIDLETILTPISDDAPAGEDLRYTSVYDDIREARRADDVIPQGDWQREAKNSDWKKVASISIKALTTKSKDFQIAAWLTEALAVDDGLSGLETGIRMITGLVEAYWETAFPLIEGDDYDYRVAPFEFMNDKLAAIIRQMALTDSKATQGYSYLKWQESRSVGYESDGKRDQREQCIAEGKITAEEFDLAVTKSSAAFYQECADSFSACLEAFRDLEAIVDERFGVQAPSLSEIGKALEECYRLVARIGVEQKGLKTAGDPVSDNSATADNPEAIITGPGSGISEHQNSAVQGGPTMVFAAPAGTDESQEALIWDEALKVIQGGGLKEALNMLLAAANSQPSERGRNRYRFLVAKLCLQVGRADLARPILEELNAMITDLQLEKWESPFWVSEILDALYQCLMSNEYVDEDPSRARELYRKICTMDVTKALGSRN